MRRLISMYEYEDFLNTEGRSLGALAHDGLITPPLFRNAIIDEIYGLVRLRKPVLLVGPSGVGKTAIIQGLAHRLQMECGSGFDKSDQNSPHNLYQLSCSDLLPTTKYVGEWHWRLEALLRYARQGTPLYFTDIWNLPETGKSANGNSNVFDDMRAAMEGCDIALIGEVTPERLQAMEGTPGFAGLFHQIQVVPLTEKESFAVLTERAKAQGLHVSAASVRMLLGLPRRFSSAEPPPGAALDLLTKVENYATDKARIGELTAITPLFVQRVFSIYSGLPLFVVSDETSKTSHEIRDWFRDQLIGQTQAISAVVETITLFKAGLNDPERPLGTLLFVGPAGVGKTELARALATFLFGSVHRLLRFDLSKFSQLDSVNRLIGSPRGSHGPAELLDPVKARPFQVILLDELEKASSQTRDLLLPLLDHGQLTSRGGTTGDFRNSIIICTANTDAQFSNPSVDFGDQSTQGDTRAHILKALGAEFRPEFLDRFQHIVIFHPLNKEQIRQVARLELERILVRDGITSRNLVVDVQDSAIDHVIDSSYDIRYGARALKREIQSRVVLPLALALMERAPQAGSMLAVTYEDDRIKVRILDTADSPVPSVTELPFRVPGQKLSKPDLEAGLLTLTGEMNILCESLGSDQLRREVDVLLTEQQSHTFWRDRGAATIRLRSLDYAQRITSRLDRLRTQIQWALHCLESITSREHLLQIGEQFVDIKEHLICARRELLYLGSDGYGDALVEITPTSGDHVGHASLLIKMYQDWSDAHRSECHWLRVPLRATEPALIRIKGHYAYGYLQDETGLHRMQGPDGHGAVRVRVIPVRDVDPAPTVDFLESRAIKGTEAYGQKIRSRLECPGGLVLQNENTLAENQNLARELFHCWPRSEDGSTFIVRRYQLDPLHIRDAATGWSTGRTDALSGRKIHELLSLRVDRLRGNGPYHGGQH
jgi:ATP-dependent Clp protease ATP-binding subunit ClpC